MTRALAAALVALLAASGSADARVKAGPNVISAHHRLGTPPGALDGGIVASAPSAAYSLRKLKSTYIGPAVQLRRASDNAVQDINFLGFVPGLGAPFDVAAANAFCASTSCFLAKWYDQSGNARDAVQATAATQPALPFNCNGTQPCGRSATNGQIIQGPIVTWAANTTSLSTVARRQSGTGQCFFVSKYFPAIVATSGVANQWLLWDQVSQQIAAVAADGAWHAGAGAIAGAASVMRIDATETTGTVTGASTAGNNTLLYMTNSSAVCDMTEGIVWDNYALTATERAALTANQRAYWGF